MIVSDSTLGVPPAGVERSRRTTVPWSTVLGLEATVPLRTLVTNRSALDPLSSAVMSQGPLIGDPAIVVTRCPTESRISRQPACMVAEWPLALGRLPATMYPLRRATRAVVSPTPPGQAPAGDAGASLANSLTLPPGEISTIVVPVPWRLDLALKLLTRTSPAVRSPLLAGTTAIPYGLTSPFLGTVEARVWTRLSDAVNGVRASAPWAAAGSRTATAASSEPAPTAAARTRLRLDGQVNMAHLQVVI